VVFFTEVRESALYRLLISADFSESFLSKKARLNIYIH